LKAQLVPVYFSRDKTEKFDRQISEIKEQLSACAQLLDPVALGDDIPASADAVLFPEILGEAYEQSAAFTQISVPILILTSEFMTISMWDWEIINFLKWKGVDVLSPYTKEQTETVCRSLAAKKEMAQSKFLIFQDNPGKGFQPEIFKCFYWWTEECTKLLSEVFGVTIERRSLKALGEKEEHIPEADARKEAESWDLPTDSSLSEAAMIQAAKFYLAVKESIGNDQSVKGIGSNCLNESHFSKTTPCAAWNQLFEREGILWACEGDTISLAITYLLYHSLHAPVMMTNIYPFLMGMAALKHEGIPNFPELVDDPENHILLAHCGYFGLAPQSFCSSWQLRPPVLGIVNETAHALDVRFPTGAVTMVKIDAAMKHIMVIEGELRGYVQYPGSDCRNGAIVRVPNGHALMKQIYSHHQLLLAGHWSAHIELIAEVFNLTVEKL